ncbi:hypothetical protein MPSEU_000132900 [Mayamaea pseudoterrestris]|nr:hypothetical protein MPSEU_000132900 [Mayamaea pseudoterrestris]
MSLNDIVDNDKFQRRNNNQQTVRMREQQQQSCEQSSLLDDEELSYKALHDDDAEVVHHQPMIGCIELPDRRTFMAKRKDRRAMFVPPLKRRIHSTDAENFKERQRPLLENHTDSHHHHADIDSSNPILPAYISITRTSSDQLPDAGECSLPPEDLAAYHHRQQRLRKQASSERWRKLSHHVRSGEHLVSRRNHDEDDSQSLSAQYSNWLAYANMFSMKECLIGMFVWIVIAVIAFRFVFGGHNWSVIDCIYFSVVTFTTVGYGDLVPETPAAKIFTMFYAASGVAWLSVVIGVLGSNIVEAQELAIDRTNRQWKRKALDLFPKSASMQLQSAKSFDSLGGKSVDSYGGRTTATAATTGTQEAEDWTLTTNSLLKSMNIKPTTSAANITTGAFLIMSVLTVFGIIMSFDPALRSMPHVDVPYFIALSAATCGYGDLVPVSQWGRFATSIFIPLIVATTAQWMKFIAKHIIDKRSKKFRRAMASRELSYEDLQLMDDDGDGNVTRAEFLEFMLLAMGKVDKKLIEELRKHFARIDTDNNGCLCKSELIENARRKLRKPKRKLELTRYKAQLLKFAATAKEESKQLRMGLQHDCSVFSFHDGEEEKMKDNDVV